MTHPKADRAVTDASGKSAAEAPSSGIAIGRALPPLLGAQIALHAAMTGQRMAAPLHVLDLGYGAWSVGVLLALFAALPTLTAMAAGRMVDRRGYHWSMILAAFITMGGAACALVACWLPGMPKFIALCVGAVASGVGTNVGEIAIQRTASHPCADSNERLRTFGWLGMAVALANVIGPVTAGFMIDLAGFPAAYSLMLLLASSSLWFARRVPMQTRRAVPSSSGSAGSTLALMQLPGMKRLLFVNWAFSASWDLHNFAVPILGHSRGYNASTIGLVLGSFTVAVTATRFAIPMVAHWIREVTVLRCAMALSGAVFGIYPFASTPWLMIGCAAFLGLALGTVQPIVMSTLHQLTPIHRRGEAIAFRSMATNASSTLMPLAFGVVGVGLGPGLMFWIMGGIVGSASWVAKGLKRAGADVRTRVD